MGGASTRTLALTVASLLAATSVASAEINYEVGLAYGHSDNIRRVSVGEESEDIAAGTFKLSIDQRGPRLNADLIADLAYNKYLNDTYSSEVVGNFAGSAVFAIVPERLQWVIADNFGQVLSDPFMPATPDNRENINYLVTGPDFTLALGAQSRLRLGAKYIATEYERQRLDSEGYRGELALIRVLSSRSSVSLNARVAQVEYERAELDADFDTTEAFVRYDVSGARTNLQLDLGYTQIDREAAEEKEDGLLLRAEVSRRLSAASVAVLAAGREFSSAGTAFAAHQTGVSADLATAPGRQSAQPFTNDYVNLRWIFDRNRTGFSLYGRWADQTYDGEPMLDQMLLTYGAQFRRDFSPLVSLVVDATATRGDFAQPNGDYDELNGGLSVQWRLSQHLTLAVTYDYLDRDSDLASGSYTENRGWISLTYGSGRQRSTLAAPTFGIDSPQP
jgi:hypothetical protein